MCNNIVLIRKLGVVTPVTDYMIQLDFCQINKNIINFSTDYMASKF